MLFINKSKLVLFFTSIFLIVPMFAGAVNYNQFIEIKADGTGTLKIVFVEKESVIKEKNSSIGNIPFTQEKLNEFFTSQNVQIKDYKVEKTPQDNSLSQVSFLISFKNVSDLNTLKGLANNQFSIDNSDSGKIFRNTISPEFFKTNSIDQIYSILYSKNVKTTNGSKKEGTVAWLRKEAKTIKDPYVCVAVFNSEGNKSETKSDEGGEEGKSCGLFGIELPFILLLGTLFMNRRRFL